MRSAKGVAMPIIRASCPSCGDVDVSPGQMKVMLCSSNGEASYTFRCPECHMVVAKQIERRIVEVLVAAGVKIQFWRLPEELNDLPDGPPISYDDLLDFHFELANPGWLDQVKRLIDDRGE